MSDEFIEKTFKRTSHFSRNTGLKIVTWKASEKPTERKRFPCDGAEGFRADDIIDARFPASTRYGATKVKILYRYYTINLGFKNYHARVTLLDGDNAGKEVSVRIS